MASLQKVGVNESQTQQWPSAAQGFWVKKDLELSATQGNKPIFQNLGKLKTIGLYG